MIATDVTFKAEPNSHKTIKRQHGFAYLLDVLHHTQILHLHDSRHPYGGKKRSRAREETQARPKVVDTCASKCAKSVKLSTLI